MLPTYHNQIEDENEYDGDEGVASDDAPQSMDDASSAAGDEDAEQGERKRRRKRRIKSGESPVALQLAGDDPLLEA